MHQCKTKTPWLACSLRVYYSMSFNNVLAPNLLQFLIHYGEVFRVARRLFLTRPIHLVNRCFATLGALKLQN